MMMTIAASGGVSTGVSNTGKSKPSSAAETRGVISAPPSSTPMMIEPKVAPSIQPLAMTSSVRMPYFAGEYAAAPNPTIA